MKNKKFWNRRSAKPAPSAPRTREVIQDLYNRACNEKGDIHYKVVAMSGRLEELTKFQAELNGELAELERREHVAREQQEREQVLPTAPPPPVEDRN